MYCSVLVILNVLFMENDKKLDLSHEGSSGNVLSKLGFLVVLAFVAACSKDTSDKVNNVVSGKPAVADSLFTPVKNADIPKADIPAKLPEFIGALGRVVKIDEDNENEYDPLKPNLYLIADSHLVPPLQRDILQIFHKLIALGVKGQSIEGIGRETEVSHDRPDPTLIDDPFRAFPRYKASGEIQSGPFAAEGVYGGELSSRGADKDLAKGIALQQQYEIAKQTIAAEALNEILRSMAVELGMSVDPMGSQDSVNELNGRLSQLSDSEKERIIQKCVLGNKSMMGFLKLRARFLYHRVQGRNAEFAETLSHRPMDIAFTVGVKHLPGLVQLLRDKKTHNVFAILPRGISEEDMRDPFTDFTQKDYEDHALKEVLFLVGLGEEVPFLD